MPIYVGNNKIGEIYFGNVSIKEGYCGNTKVFDHGYPPGEVLFDSSLQGFGPGTYSIFIEFSCRVEIHMVGGGGGGYAYRQSGGRPNLKTWYVGGGGSGGYVSGEINVSPGIYSISVGAGGSGGSGAYVFGSAGGNSTFLGQSANGGGGASSGGGGSGGGYTITEPNLSGTYGNAGNFIYLPSTTYTPPAQPGGSSVYGEYGKGGNGLLTGGESGSAGYVKIVVI